MPEHLRALVFVLALATPVLLFAGLQRIGLPIERADYRRRAWMFVATTLIAFLSHDFWVFLAALVVAIRVAAPMERNPLALYLVVLLAVPPFFKEIPGVLGIDHLMVIDPPRVLALFLLLPAWLTLRARRDADAFGSLLPDKLLLGYWLVYLGAQLSYDTFTNALRIGLVYPFLDIFLPYYVASRSVRSLKVFKDVLATVAVMAMVLALVGLFESVRTWLLYAPLEGALGVDWQYSNYLFRGFGGALRVQASLGHSIVFGYALVLGLTMFAFFRPTMSAPRYLIDPATAGSAVARRPRRATPSAVRLILAVPMALLSFFRPSTYVPGRPALRPPTSNFPALAWNVGALVLAAGIVASLSRGPWVGLAAAALVLAATGPEVASRLGRLGLGAAVAVALLLGSPAGREAMDFLPFVGTVDEGNVDYRERLFDVSLAVIAQRPWFGAVDFMANPMLEPMRQGEGIIDIVNTYLGVALRNGLVGLALFGGVFLAVIAGLVGSLRSVTDKDSEVHLLGRVLLAALVGSLVIITTVSSILVVPMLYWVLAGLGVGYRRMVQGGVR